ncbi:unnamed protein product [Owenia fusiformis]|uniref:Hormone-sensitive lipase n=1 Tax=Owenia fusiformis TaxID=6347 RepID=A0A8S4PSU7_OWEFU|nr:unnamed protein product [Owenia fusiformis]
MTQVPEKDVLYGRKLKELFKTLRSSAIDNAEYFQSNSTDTNVKFYKIFCAMHEHLDVGVEPSVEFILNIAHAFDFKPSVPANGYRSVVKIVEKCCLHLVQLTRHITVNRGTFMFRSIRGTHYVKELDAYVKVLTQLRAVLHYLQKLVSYCKDGDLFAQEEMLKDEAAEKLLVESEGLDQEAFYGRCVGFQFCQSMQRPLQVIGVAMASFSESYQESSSFLQFANSFINSGKYLLDPELRAKQIVSITRNSTIQFCKAFWGITDTDVLHQLPMLACPAVEVDHMIKIPAEPLDVSRRKGREKLTVLPPSAHNGPGPVHVRLISYELRKGQFPIDKTTTRESKVHPKSPCLLVHCHGGGFVAQSSKSHQVYLRHWAKDLGIPIVSIDYSLAPESPFPRALEEIFFAYCWILNNFHQLGTTGERICFAGDSAGGNLMISTTLALIKRGLRLPDGLMAAYSPVLVRYIPSPSRALSIMDPLLPVGILLRCLAAYSGFADPTDTKDATMTTEQHSNNNDANSNATTNADFSIDSASDDDTISDDQEDVLFEATARRNSPPAAVHKPSPSRAQSKSPVKEQDQSDPSMKSKSIVDTNKLKVTHDNVNKSIDKPSNDKSNSVAKGARRSPASPSRMHRVSSAMASLGELEEGLQDLDTYTSDMPQNAIDEDSSESKIDQVIRKDINKSSPFPEVDSGSITKPTKSIKIQSLPLNTHGKNGLTRHQRSTSYHNFNFPSNLSSPSSPNSDDYFRMEFELEQDQARQPSTSPLQQLRHLPIPNNPFMSPLLASDELLKQFPPVFLVACTLDPILDDNVAFAKKLESLGTKVCLDVSAKRQSLQEIYVSQELEASLCNSKSQCDWLLVFVSQILIGQFMTNEMQYCVYLNQ